MKWLTLVCCLCASAASAGDALSDFEAELTSGLAQALDDGLLTLAPDATLEAAGDGNLSQARIKIASATDRADATEFVAPPGCAPWPELEFLTGDASETDLEDLSRQRLAFANSDGDAAELRKLVYLQLRLGMGAEAMQLLNALSEDEANALATIATILEHRPLSEAQAEKLAQPCSPMESLWALAAMPRRDARPKIILPAFETLAMQLRQHLAGTLALNALDSDMPKTAGLIVSSADRRSGAQDDYLLLARARLAAADGDEEGALDLLADITSRDSPVLAAALETSFEIENRAGAADRFDLAERLEDYTMRYPDRWEMALLLATTLLNDHDYSRAFDIAASARITRHQPTRERVWRKLLTHTPDENHLNAYIAALLSVTDRLPADASLEDARRSAFAMLHEAGFNPPTRFAADEEPAKVPEPEAHS